MSERRLTIVGVILTIVFGLPAWWALFIEHPETVTTMTWALRVATPVLTFLAGMFTGWHLSRWKSESPIQKVLNEDEKSAHQIKEKVRGMSAEGRAVLSYVIDSISPVVMEIGETDCQLFQLGMFEVEDSGLVRWESSTDGRAIVTVLPEVRNAVTDDQELWQSMKHGELPFFKTYIAAHDVHTSENAISRLYGKPAAQALRVFLETPEQMMREDRAKRLKKRIPFLFVGTPENNMSKVVLLNDERESIIENMTPLIDLKEYFDVSDIEPYMKADAIEAEIEKGEF